jgi:hypothetical protein
MGKKRVLTDHQRYKKKLYSVRVWRRKNRDRYNELMRNRSTKEAKAAYMREYRKRMWQRELEDSFERVMDVRDGFFSREEIQVKRKVKHIKPKIVTELKSTEEQRKKWRGKFRGYYMANSDKLCKKERDRYYKNKEAISLRRKELYMLKKVAI